jgi:hypothetical protein
MDTQSVSIEVFNFYKPIIYTYKIEHEFCENDGSITINVSQGNQVRFSLNNGPYTRNNVFDNLTSGNYKVIIVDSCESSVELDVTILEKSTSFNIAISGPGAPLGTACDSIQVQHSLAAAANSEIQYPLIFNYHIFPPNNSPEIVLSQNIDMGNPFDLLFVPFNIPFYAGMPYSYTLEIIDNCGDITNFSHSINSSFEAGIWQHTAGCKWNMTIWTAPSHPPLQVTFLEAPSGFNPFLFTEDTDLVFDGAPIFSNNSISMPDGYYKIKVSNMCGKADTIQGNYTLPLLTANTLTATPDCEPNLGIIHFYSSFDMKNVFDITMPSNIADLSYGISKAEPKQFFHSNLNPGLHIIELRDSCNRKDTISFNVPIFNGKLDTFYLIKNCGSFDLFFNYNHNDEFLAYFTGPRYYLQYRDGNNWRDHFSNDIYATPTSWGGSNSYDITNNFLTANINREGEFRIVRLINRPNFGGSTDVNVCEKIVHEFNFVNDGFSFDSLYFTECFNAQNGNSSYTVLCEAAGKNPLNYTIIHFNGSDTLIQNGNNNVFSNLEAGFYMIKVNDDCGNEAIRDIQLTNLVKPIIKADSLCSGTNGKLFIDYSPFFTYEWRKVGNSQILSTGSSLRFEPFTSQSPHGSYSLKMIFNSAISCADREVFYSIPIDSTTTQSAGNDVNWMICDSISEINLFSYLSQTATQDGYWLNENNGVIVNPLNYPVASIGIDTQVLTYIVDKRCGLDEMASISLIKDTCNTPCIEITGKLKLSTPIGGQPGYKIMVFNPDMTLGVMDLSEIFKENITNKNINLSTSEKTIQLLEKLSKLKKEIEILEKKITNNKNE